MKLVRPAALLISAALAVGGAGEAHAQKRGGILRSFLPDNPPSASIHEESTISVAMPFSALYNNLVFFDHTKKRDAFDTIIPELATSWKWSEDNTRLTFQLREGVKWHDGKPFTSADVKCTWDMLAGKTEAKLRKNPRKSWYRNLKEVTTNGPTEVTFVLGRPQPSLLMMLAGAFSPVYPCHVPAAQMRTKPIGTGPFKFVSFKQNEGIKLTRNPDYWKKGEPYLDGIEWTMIPSRSTAILAFVSGQVDLTYTNTLTAPLLRDVKQQSPDAVCAMEASNVQNTLVVNREVAPFDDPDIRRAMMLAIDRKAFVNSIFDGEAIIGGSMLPPPAGQWGMPAEKLSDVPGYGDDVEKARAEGRKLMEAHGYGPDKPLKVKVSTRNHPAYRDPAVLLIDHLKNVYIDGELDLLDTSVWYARMVRKEYQVGLNTSGIGIDDPDVNFYENFACGSERNYTRYCNPEMDKLFDQQSAMTDMKQRKELVWKIDKMLQMDGARPVIAHTRGGTCWHPYVKGVDIPINGIYNHWRFDDVWMDK